MNEERKRVLDLLSEGKINADECERLLNALTAAARVEERVETPFPNLHRLRPHLHRMHDHIHGRAAGGERRFVQIVVDKDTGEGRTERVRIKVPVKLLKAGISLSGLMPKDVRERVQEALKEKGIDVDPFALRGTDTDEIIAALHDLEIDIGNKGEKVRIFTAGSDDDEDDEGDDDGVTRETEGPGGERTVERTIRRRRFRRDSGVAFDGDTSRLSRLGHGLAHAGTSLFRMVLTPFVWLMVAVFLAVRGVLASVAWVALMIARVVSAPFRWIGRGMIVRASWRRGITDRTMAA
jgi:Fe-S-cluster formation regulator IscX/YfhJ